jgi:hypothetical protein
LFFASGSSGYAWAKVSGRMARKSRRAFHSASVNFFVSGVGSASLSSVSDFTGAAAGEAAVAGTAVDTGASDAGAVEGAASGSASVVVTAPAGVAKAGGVGSLDVVVVMVVVVVRRSVCSLRRPRGMSAVSPC